MAPTTRTIQEYDFFTDDEYPRPTRLIVLPRRRNHCPKEYLFPEILGPSAERAHVEKPEDHHDHPIIKKRKVTTIRLFGKNINVVSNKPRKHPENKQPSAPLPEPILEAIQRRGGADPVFLFEKTLEQWDVERGQNRVYVTKSGKLIEALTEEERQKVDRDKDSLDIPTVDPYGNEYVMQLTRWHSVGEDVIKRDWSKLVRANELEAGDRVEGWGYRRDDDGIFCLALTIFKRPPLDD